MVSKVQLHETLSEEEDISRYPDQVGELATLLRRTAGPHAGIIAESPKHGQRIQDKAGQSENFAVSGQLAIYLHSKLS